MGEITGTAIFFSLTFLTPALPFFIFYRLFIPKPRAMVGSDFLIILICCLLSLISNATLLIYFINNISSILVNTNLTNTDLNKVLIGLLGGSGIILNPWRPVLNWFGQNTSSTNLFVFILDLHARTAAYAICISFGYWLVSWIEDWLMFLPYSKNAKAIYISKILGIKISFDDSRYVIETKKFQSIALVPLKFLFAIQRYIRELVCHPWTLLTRYNPKRELLMADVLTAEGSIYSGILMNWVPAGDDLQAISLQYVLRYMPEVTSPRIRKIIMGDDIYVDKKQMEMSRPVRKKILIKNNGELTISADEIQTVHIWKLRRRFEPEILIRGPADVEVLKWYLLLSLVQPTFFEKIWVHLLLPERS